MEKVQDLDIFLKNMTKKIVLKDLNNRNYTVEDFDRFRSHINSYHSKGSSIHEENGFFFRIDDNFRAKLDSLSQEDN